MKKNGLKTTRSVKGFSSSLTCCIYRSSFKRVQSHTRFVAGKVTLSPTNTTFFNSLKVFSSSVYKYFTSERNE